MVQEVGRLPTKHMPRALREHLRKPHGRHAAPYKVAIDKLRIAERGGNLPKQALHALAVLPHLPFERIALPERHQRMRVGLSQHLYLARPRKLLEGAQHLGRVHLELVERNARNGKGKFHPAPVARYQLEEKRIHRQVALFGHLAHDRCIRLRIEVIVLRANIKKSVAAKPKRLVYLKVKANCTHNLYP